jgi:hypothetical protein
MIENDVERLRGYAIALLRGMAVAADCTHRHPAIPPYRLPA